MKKHFLILSIFAGLFLSVFFVSCEKDNSTSTNTLLENEIINEESDNKQIDQCFLVRGRKGKLLDLHIARDENNHAFITTSPAQVKSTDENIPEYIIIADGVEFIDNKFILPETDNNYYIFEMSLGDPDTPKAPPGGGTITASCNCLAPSGSCTVTYTVVNDNVFSAQCFSSVDAECSVSGVGQCQWTLPEVIVTKELVDSQKTTTVIIESDKLDYNGLPYE